MFLFHTVFCLTLYLHLDKNRAQNTPHEFMVKITSHCSTVTEQNTFAIFFLSFLILPLSFFLSFFSLICLFFLLSPAAH